MPVAGQDDTKLRKAFLEEAEDLVQKLGETLPALETVPESRDLINEVFRLTHSLKSESAFMGFSVLSELAHKMEDVLGLARDGRRGLDEEVMDRLFEGADLVAAMMSAIAGGGRDADTDAHEVIEKLSAIAGPAAGGTAPTTGGTAPTAGGPSGNGGRSEADAQKQQTRQAVEERPAGPCLTDFDRNRLVEARERGETPWRIIATVEPDEPMKFPRAFLVFANLEQTANVIATEPALEGEPVEDARYAHTTYYVTTDRGEEALREAGSVDQIAGVSIEKLDYETLLKEPVSVPEPVVQQGAAAAPSAAPGAAPEAQQKQAPLEKTSIRVETRKLDDLWSLVAELVLHKAHISRLSDSVARGMDLATVREELAESSDSLDKITGGMQQAMRDTRMIPISVIFTKFPRLVRDLSRKLEKPVELSVTGEDTEIDRSIVEALSEPLTHIIRNSLDHGLEFPEERVRLAKPEKGRLTVAARRQGGTIVIDVVDDGRGMDTDRIRQKALSLGIARAAELSETQLLELVFLPGFSTKEVVTDLSGRGVGMDVVATRIRGELKGDVELASERGKGTRVTLRLPLTLTIVNSLLVLGDGHLYAIPIADVDGTAKLPDSDIRETQDGEVCTWMDEELPLYSVGALLGRRRRNQDEHFCVVLRHGIHRALLVVDELIEEREIVIKPVDDLLNYDRLFSGVSVLEDGRLVFILDTSFIRRENF